MDNSFLLDESRPKAYNTKVMNQQTYTIWTDGGARRNPGPAGIGAVIAITTGSNDSQHEIIGEVSDYIGQTTNNQAEYRALIAALAWFEAYLAEKQIAKSSVILHLYTDSELMAYQIQGKYKVKNAELVPCFKQVETLLKDINYTITPVPRAKNQRADKLVNEAIDAALTQIAH
jgi:ribonuclease HI